MVSISSPYADLHRCQMVRKRSRSQSLRPSRLVIAHRLSTVKRADTFLVIGMGKVAEEGRHEEMFSLSGVYRKSTSPSITFDRPDVHSPNSERMTLVRPAQVRQRTARCVRTER